MKKVLLTAMSGALIGLTSFSAQAMNQTEMVSAVSAETGYSNHKTFNALDAYEKQLKSEMSAGRAVRVDGVGEYRPRYLAGMRSGTNARSGQATQYENWKLVKNPTVVSDAEFNKAASARAGIDETEYSQIINSYKMQKRNTLRMGGSVSMHGDGTYKATLGKDRVYYRRDGSGEVSSTVPGKYSVKFRGAKGNRYTFRADPTLVP